MSHSADEQSLFPRPTPLPRGSAEKNRARPGKGRSPSNKAVKAVRAVPDTDELVVFEDTTESAPRPDARVLAAIVATEVPSPAAPSPAARPPVRKRETARNLLRLAAIAGAVSGIGLLARAATEAPAARTAPVHVAPAAATAQVEPGPGPLQATLPPAGAQPRKATPVTAAASSPAPRGRETQPTTLRPPRAEPTRLSLRDLAARSPQHEAVARALMALDPARVSAEREQRVAAEIKALGAPALAAIEDMATLVEGAADRRVLASALLAVDPSGDAAGRVLALVRDPEVAIAIARGLPESADSSDSLAVAFEVEATTTVRRELLKEYARRLRVIGPDDSSNPPVPVADEERDAFFKLAAFDESATVRADAVRVLAQMAAPRGLDLLDEVVARETDAEVRRLALVALGASGGEAALPSLAGIAGADADAGSRLAAVEGLGRVQGAAAIEVLEALELGATDDEVRRAAGETARNLRAG